MDSGGQAGRVLAPANVTSYSDLRPGLVDRSTTAGTSTPQVPPFLELPVKRD